MVTAAFDGWDCWVAPHPQAAATMPASTGAPATTRRETRRPDRSGSAPASTPLFILLHLSRHRSATGSHRDDRRRAPGRSPCAGPMYPLAGPPATCEARPPAGAGPPVVTEPRRTARDVQLPF